MKQLIFTVSAVAGIMCVGGAYSAARVVGGGGSSVVKCVKLSATTACTTDKTSFIGKPEWTANCGGITVKGIAKCSSTAGSAYTKHTSIALGTSTTANKYCKCKMISPAVSTYWVSVNVCKEMVCISPGMQTAQECETYCAFSCAQDAAVNTDNFRTALFNSLTD